MTRTNLINLRKKEGLSQTALARLVGIHKSSLCKIEKGRTRGDLDTWDKLEAVLGIDQKILRQVDDTTSSAP
jgi:DNA-binding XRE family transcriptional regulator